MYRWDVINFFIEKNNYKSYLEIGYFKGWSFDSVKGVQLKVAVDPKPCKEPRQEQVPHGGIILLNKDPEDMQFLHKKTSDELFHWYDTSTDPDFTGEKFDIIFIDGLHEATQVTRDIENSLKYLSPGGTIVLHDCNPPTLEHSTTGDCGGNWNGDVYKAFIKARVELPFLTYTIDTDWGVGVIHPNIPAEPLNFPVEEITYDTLKDNRMEALNLISVGEFKTKMNEETKDHNVPA